MATSISAVLIPCLKAFNQLQEQVEQPNYNRQEEVSSNLWGDELGRLRVWAANIGAHQTGQSSLDFRLRDASHISRQITNLLQDLEQSLKDVFEELSGDGIEPFEDDESAAAWPGDGSTTELQQIHGEIVNIIDCMYQLSMLIRKPAQHDMLVGSRMGDKAEFEFYDKEHVRNLHPKTEERIGQRLGHAITRRRKYLFYRERHHRKLERGIEEAQGIQRPIAESVISETIATDFKTSNIEFEETSSNSGMSQTSYAPSLIDGGRVTIPPPPKESVGGKPFECPYCFFVIDIKSTRSWNRHIFKDIKPYVCTFSDCSMPDRLYDSRREWYFHEKTEHPREDLVCPLCKDTLKSPKQYERHVARHLEELALFALPRTESDDAEDDDTNHSVACASKISSEDSSIDGEDGKATPDSWERIPDPYDHPNNYGTPTHSEPIPFEVSLERKGRNEMLQEFRSESDHQRPDHEIVPPALTTSDNPSQGSIAAVMAKLAPFKKEDVRSDDDSLLNYSLLTDAPQQQNARESNVNALGRYGLPTPEGLSSMKTSALETAQTAATTAAVVKKAVKEHQATTQEAKATPAKKTKPIRFTDALGRRSSVPFDAVKTWLGMERFIKEAFLHVSDLFLRVNDGQYDLVGSQDEIILPGVWASVIEPGWEITMRMWPNPERPPSWEYARQKAMRQQSDSLVVAKEEDGSKYFLPEQEQDSPNERTFSRYKGLGIYGEGELTGEREKEKAPLARTQSPILRHSRKETIDDLVPIDRLTNLEDVPVGDTKPEYLLLSSPHDIQPHPRPRRWSDHQAPPPPQSMHYSTPPLTDPVYAHVAVSAQPLSRRPSVREESREADAPPEETAPVHFRRRRRLAPITATVRAYRRTAPASSDCRERSFPASQKSVSDSEPSAQ